MLHCLKFFPSWRQSSLPIASELLATKPRLRTPAVTSFLPSEVQPGCSHDSADDSWQNCVRSVSCQLTMRQWGFTEYKLCSSVWGYNSWHETITHHPTPLPFIKKKTKTYSYYDFSCWVKPYLFQGINMRELMVSVWDSSSYFLPTSWQHKCNNGCSLVRVISPYVAFLTSGGIWDVFNISGRQVKKKSLQPVNILPASTHAHLYMATFQGWFVISNPFWNELENK